MTKKKNNRNNIMMMELTDIHNHNNVNINDSDIRFNNNNDVDNDNSYDDDEYDDDDDDDGDDDDDDEDENEYDDEYDDDIDDEEHRALNNRRGRNDHTTTTAAATDRDNTQRAFTNYNRRRNNSREDNTDTNRESNFMKRVLYRHWFGSNSDADWTYIPKTNTNTTTNNENDRRIVIINSNGMKLLKFYIITMGLIVVMHSYVRWTKNKHDDSYDLYSKLVLYDLQAITLDIITFFVVGRLYASPSIDTLEFLCPCLSVALFQSWGATYLSQLEYSITLYEMKCEWGYAMYLLIFGICLPFLLCIVVLHIRESYRRQIHIQKLIELVVSIGIFVMPFVGNQFFHLHHWYYSWFVGMHCNLHSSWTGVVAVNHTNNRDDGIIHNNNNINNNSRHHSCCCWWSRLCMSLFWGIYINGIGIFGRDPIMTCAITLYQSQNQQCPYITLVKHLDLDSDIVNRNSSTDTSYKPEIDSNNSNTTTKTNETVSTIVDTDIIDIIGNECCTMGYGNYTLDDLAHDIGFYNHIIHGNEDDDDENGEFQIGSCT